jgi:TonB family protein
VTFLTDFTIKSALALSMAFLVALALRKSSASVRYALWTCTLAALLVLPVVALIGPEWKIVARRHALRSGTIAPTEEQAPLVSVVADGRRPVSQQIPLIIWTAGVVAMLTRVAAGHWRVRSLFGTAEKICDPRWLALAQETAASIAFARPLALKRSTATDVPLSYGLVRATVLLPGESEYWTEERRRIVLSHEMIHAGRLDSLWGLLAQCALAANWFNPLAWLAVARFRREQERSCDDAVVAAGTASTLYAAHLVDLARSIAIPGPALGMAERFDLEGRVHALLDPSRKRQPASRRLCAAIFGIALALIVPLAAIHAQAASPEEPQAGSIFGSVYDPSGAIVPSATITLKNTSGPNEEGAATDSNGSYKLKGLPAGEYLLKVRARGFAAYQKTLTLEAGASAAVNVHLAIGDGEESVVVTGQRSQGATPSSATPPQIRTGGEVQAFNLIRKVNPVYPPDAKAEGVEGAVLLRAIISKNGSLLSIVPVSSSVDQRLVSAAVAAVSQWQYQPTLLNGEPVEAITTITVSFRLN